MKDINGEIIEPGEVFYLNKHSAKYILIQYNEEDETFHYREHGNFTIWCGDYDYHKHNILKAKEFNLKKKKVKKVEGESLFTLRYS